MKKIIVCIFVFVIFVWSVNAQTKLQNLLVETAEKPIGIDVKIPHFSWQISSKEKGFRQTAYQIEVADEDGNKVWDSGKINSGEAVNIAYGGNALQAATKYDLKVTVWNQKGKSFTAKSQFETGLMNSDANLSAWDGAEWIGGDAETLPFYADYFSIFKLSYTQQIAQGSERASFIVGANDPRLMDRNKNIFQLESKTDESYIRFELDVSEVEKSASGSAKFNVYRVGYTDTDKTDVPLVSFDVLPSVINEKNKHEAHRIELGNRWGGFLISIDGNSNFAVVKDDANKNKPVLAAVNPFGTNGAVNTFGMLCEMGFAVPANQKASFANIEISNFRSPSHILFKDDLSKPFYENTPVKDEKYEIDGGAKGVFIVKNPSRNSMPLLRTVFKTESKKIEKARLYATARGIYEIYLNGKRVGNDFYNPGLTQYPKTHLYQTYDVTNLVQKGENAIGAMLGEGWWSGVLSFDAIHNHFGDRQSLLAKLVITYADGTTSVVTTNDKTWKYYNNGAILYSSLQLGEVYEATRETKIAGWDTIKFDDKNWKTAVKISLEGTTYTDNSGKYDYSQMKLSGQIGNSAGVFKTLTAKSVKEVRPKVFVYDMGQNLTGVPRIVFPDGKAGNRITLRVSEMLYPNLPESKNNVGMIMTENYRAALSQDVYTMRDGAQTFQPHFTQHAYQYLEITGIETALPLENVQGVAISSILKLTADYETSNPKVNRLWSNIVWSNIDNFLSIPTDCPQRNERMGWGGDISVFSPTAVYVSNSSEFFKRHLVAMRDMQFPTGRFADIAPVGGGGGGILWGSAGIIMPWESYLQYNDKTILEENYPAMSKYVDYLSGAVNKDTGMLNEFGLGDWLGPQYAQLGVPFLATAYHIYDLEIMSKIASVLGKTDDAEKFKKLRDERKAFFNSKFVNAERKTMVFTSKTRGVPPEWKVADTQTSYAVGLSLNAFSDENIPFMKRNLAETVSRKNIDDAGVLRPEYSLMTGFIGTSWISKALSESGNSEAAYKLLQNEQYPSWLYPVNQGATTIWERLNGYTVENGFGGNNSMNSFNHYSFGAVGRWMIAYSLGIQRDETNPGFKHFILQPEPDLTGQMTWAKGFYDSMYGRINSSWKVEKDNLTYSATVPANTTATVYLPSISEKDVKENGRNIVGNSNIQFIKYANGKAIFEVNSGEYLFTSRLK